MRQWALALLENGSVVDEAVPGAPARFTWFHLDGRDPHALEWISNESGIPPAAVRALTATETRPRTEILDGGAIINLRGLGETSEEDSDPLVSIRIWTTVGQIISVSFRTLDGIDAVREAMSAGRLTDPGDLISALALQITERLDPDVADLGDQLDDCETTLDPDKAFAMRRAIGRIRSRAIGYRRFVMPQRLALERLAAIECDWLADDDRIHLRDAADRFARMTEELEAVRERSALLHEQLTDLRAERVEARTLILSIVALVFLPLTFLTGLLGMNVEGIPFAREPWAFWGVFAFCVATALLITLWFVRRRWFRG